MHSSTSTLTITVNSTLYFLNLAFSARGQIIFQINKHTLQGIWHKREYLRHINLDTIWYVCRQGYVLPCKIYFLHLAIHSSARTISRCFFLNLIIRQANSSKSSLLLITKIHLAYCILPASKQTNLIKMIFPLFLASYGIHNDTV